MSLLLSLLPFVLDLSLPCILSSSVGSFLLLPLRFLSYLSFFYCFFFITCRLLVWFIFSCFFYLVRVFFLCSIITLTSLFHTLPVLVFFFSLAFFFLKFIIIMPLFSSFTFFRVFCFVFLYILLFFFHNHLHLCTSPSSSSLYLLS